MHPVSSSHIAVTFAIYTYIAGSEFMEWGWTWANLGALI